MCIDFSKIFLILDKREIGQQLLQSSLSPSLWIGKTFAILRIFGNTPLLKDIFIISFKGFKNSFLNSFKILVGILFGPLALFVFSELVSSSMSSGIVGERKIMFFFQDQDMKNEFFYFDSVSVYFFSNTCKKVIKGVRNLFGTGY